MINYATSHDAETGVFKLTLSQESKSDEGPLLIPVAVRSPKSRGSKNSGRLWWPRGEGRHTFLREFSAPVKLVDADSSSSPPGHRRV